MARQSNRLTARKVETEKMAGEYPDGNGLYLVVSEAGTKSWSFYYTLNGRSRQMGLGTVRDVSLLEARSKRDDCRKLLANKIDPIDARKDNETKVRLAALKGMTFEQCARAYIDAHKEGWRNAKHIQQWENTLPAYAYPVLGKILVQDIDVNLILKVLEPIWKKKTETANRIRGRIEAILDWAAAREYRQGENPARWRGRLDSLLPKRSKIQKVKHHPALSYNQMGEFMRLLKKQVGLDARALEFVILTGTRTSEVTGATWEEIDRKAKVWTIPGERMKAGREHRVPLSESALAVLKTVLTFKEAVGQDKKSSADAPKGWVFPGRKRGKGLSNMAMLALLRRLNRQDITVHGFRSTFRDWAAEQTAFPREVAEAALAHAVESKVEAAYRRSDLFDKRRKLMDAWARYCNKTTIGDKT